jgi:hypothetical protein
MPIANKALRAVGAKGCLSLDREVTANWLIK